LASKTSFTSEVMRTPMSPICSVKYFFDDLISVLLREKTADAQMPMKQPKTTTTRKPNEISSCVRIVRARNHVSHPIFLGARQGERRWGARRTVGPLCCFEYIHMCVCVCVCTQMLMINVLIEW